MRNMAKWKRLKTFLYSAMYVSTASSTYVIKVGSHEKHGQVEEAEEVSVLCYVREYHQLNLRDKGWESWETWPTEGSTANSTYMINGGSHEKKNMAKCWRHFRTLLCTRRSTYVIKVGSHEKHGQVEEAEDISVLCAMYIGRDYRQLFLHGKRWESRETRPSGRGWRVKIFSYSAMYLGREYRQLNLRNKPLGVMRNITKWKRLKPFPNSVMKEEEA